MSTPEGRDSEWKQNDLFSFWDRGAFTSTNFQCCLELVSTSKKDVKENVTGRDELLKGSGLQLVGPESCKPDVCEVSQETVLLYRGCSIQRVLFI